MKIKEDEHHRRIRMMEIKSQEQLKQDELAT